MCFSSVKEKIIEKIVPQRMPLKDFFTFADLEAWFELRKGLVLDPPNLCDDYARESRALAESDGYFLSTQLVWAGEVWGTKIFDFLNPDGTPVYHIGNLAICSDTQTFYYVDLNWSKLVELGKFIPGGKF